MGFESRAGHGFGGVHPTAVTTITVTAEAAQAGFDDQAADAAGDPAAAKTVQPAAVAAAPVSPVLDLTGVEKSALYRINPDNTVETLWSSKEENIATCRPRPARFCFRQMVMAGFTDRRRTAK